MLYIDFETRSEVDLKKCGAWKYSEDPSTKPLCMAYGAKYGRVKLWVPGEEIPKAVIKWTEKGWMFEAHNAFFEKCIWKNIMVKRYGWPEIPDDCWSCSLAKTSAHALPRGLDGACQALNLPVQKNMDGHRIMMKMAKPRKITKNNKDKWHNDREDFEKLYEYCMNDVEAERCLSEALMDLNLYERDIWLLDQKINARGLRIDIDAAHAAIKIAEEFSLGFVDQLTELTGGVVTRPTQNIRLRDWLREEGVELPGVGKDVVDNALEHLALPDHCREVLEIKQKLSKTSIAKYKSMINAASADDIVRGLLMYWGASTGRWTGRLVQPHNFPQNKFKSDLEIYFKILKMGDTKLFEMCYSDVMQTISWGLRGTLIPEEGKSFFGGDYAAIEARVVMWLAEDEHALQIFKEGKDIYMELACKIYNRPLSSIMPDQRSLGKQAILGCGFGMGAETFVKTCANYKMYIPLDFAQIVVKAYRNQYSKVVKFWYAQERAAMMAINSGRFIKEGKIGWKMLNGFLYCKLPSKRLLAYYDPKIMKVKTPWGDIKDSITYMAVNSLTKKWEREKTYGGKITENITQAVARDLIVGGMLECEKNGYEIVLTVHDEIIAQKESGTKEEFVKHMMYKPEWGLDIPINVTPWTGKRYLK